MSPPLAIAIVGLILIAVAAMFGGLYGALGMAVGLGGSALNQVATHRAIGTLNPKLCAEPELRQKGAIVAITFLFKIPILVALAMAMRAIGPTAWEWFLGGFGLVYFGLVGWALANR